MTYQQQDDFALVMTMGEFAFQAAHIPSSRSISRLQDALAVLDKEEDIVGYCAS